MTIFFQFGTLTIQVTPEKDFCLITQSGKPLWCGGKDELIDILESIHKTP